MTLTGAGLLWFGWFGFNAGSALAAGQTAALAFVTTHVAAAAAALLAGSLAEWVQRGKPTALGVVSGLVAGLVAITPAAGFVSPGGGARHRARSPASSATARCCSRSAGTATTTRSTRSACTASAACSARCSRASSRRGALNPAGADGLLAGNPSLLWKQAVGLGRGRRLHRGAHVGILFVVDKVIGLRVSEDEEREGLDATQHGEAGYSS